MLSEYIQKQIDDLNKQLDEAVSIDLKNGAKELFDQYPNLQSLGWVQYTPYFCDGDPCHFSVHTDPSCDIRVNKGTIDDYYDVDEEIIQAELHLSRSEVEQIASQFSKLIEVFNYDALERLFDEGEIIINRELEIKTHDYSHD